MSNKENKQILDEAGLAGTDNILFLGKEDSNKIDFSGSINKKKNILKEQEQEIKVEEALNSRYEAQRRKAKKDLEEYGKVNGMSGDRADDYGDGVKKAIASDNVPVKASLLNAEPEVELLGYGVMERLLPKGIGSNTATNITDMINERIVKFNPVMGEHFRDNCVSWVDCMKGTRYSAKQYLDAVTYVTHRMAGDSQIRAYTKTFPERISRMEREGISMANLSNYVGVFNSSKLVAEIYTQALVPTHIMYNDYFHKAILVQVEIMNDPKVSAKVRSDTAANLAQQLKSPEIKKAEVSISLSENDTIVQLREAMTGLAQAQKESIDKGNNLIIDISAAEIIKDDTD